MGNIYHEWDGTTLIITSDSGTSAADLKGKQGDIGIRGPQGPASPGTVIPNPTDEATQKLEKLTIGETTYFIPDGGSSLDVQIDGSSIVQNNVANIPVANPLTLGAVRVNSAYGIEATQSDAGEEKGMLKVVFARNADIDTRESNRYPITPAYLDYAVKAGITTNTLSLSDEEKQNAQAWLGISGGTAQSVDVQINGTSIVENGVANIPIASASTAGVIKTNEYYGLFTKPAAYGEHLVISCANEDSIKNKASNYRPIVPAKLDFAIKVGLTTNTLTLTDEEKQNAQTWLGLNGGGGTQLYKHIIQQRDPHDNSVILGGCSITIISTSSKRLAFVYDSIYNADDTILKPSEILSMSYVDASAFDMPLLPRATAGINMLWTFQNDNVKKVMTSELITLLGIDPETHGTTLWEEPIAL